MISFFPESRFPLIRDCQSLHTNCQGRESPSRRAVEDWVRDDGVMHEVSIMAEAVQIAVASAREAGAGRITGLRLRVGRLSGAVPEALEFAWDVVRCGTMAEGAWLEIKTVPAAAWCETCQAEFDCADFLVTCPRCQQPASRLVRGRELEIDSVETAACEVSLISKQ